MPLDRAFAKPMEGLRLLAAAVIVAFLTGCSSSGPGPTVGPPETPRTETSEAVVSPTSEVIIVEEMEVTMAPVETVRGLDGEPKPVASGASIAPDPDVMASMACEPVRPDVLECVRLMFGTPDRSVQVEVGEGVWPAETWWVVVLDTPPDETSDWEELRPFLTNGPQVPEGKSQYGSRWIPLDDSWSRVYWDAERLMLGKSALAKALACLDG